MRSIYESRKVANLILEKCLMEFLWCSGNYWDDPDCRPSMGAMAQTQKMMHQDWEMELDDNEWDTLQNEKMAARKDSRRWADDASEAEIAKDNPWEAYASEWDLDMRECIDIISDTNTDVLVEEVNNISKEDLLEMWDTTFKHIMIERYVKKYNIIEGSDDLDGAPPEVKAFLQDIIDNGVPGESADDVLQLLNDPSLTPSARARLENLYDTQRGHAGGKPDMAWKQLFYGKNRGHGHGHHHHDNDDEVTDTFGQRMNSNISTEYHDSGRPVIAESSAHQRGPMEKKQMRDIINAINEAQGIK